MRRLVQEAESWLGNGGHYIWAIEQCSKIQPAPNIQGSRWFNVPFSQQATLERCIGVVAS